MEFHPLTAIFPLMEGQEFTDFKEDIQKNGLLQPIWTFEGKILDGRNRYRACQEIGVQARYEQWRGVSPISFVVSMNVRRRHLTPAQRAIAATEALPHYEAEAKKRQGERTDIKEKIPGSEEGQARDQAASDFNVNHHYISDMKSLRQEAPDLVEKIKTGELKIPQAKKELRKREAPKAPPIPSGKFRVIYADPPWQYGNRYGDHLKGYSRPDHHYPTMPLEDICNLPVWDMAEDDAVLFLWTTSPLLEDAFKVVKAWGFKYKTSFVWDKVKHNFGHYNSVRHEFLLLATKGSCTPDAKKLHDSVVSISRGGHSVKPEYFRTLIDELYTHGNRVELFAREKTEGWETWGNQP